MKFKARVYRSRHKPGQMNNTEFEYSKKLELMKQAGEIVDYSFECTRLKIGNDCWYTPDFRVLRLVSSNLKLKGYNLDRKEWEDLKVGSLVHKDYEKVIIQEDACQIIEFHEVKGTIRKKRTVGKLGDQLNLPIELTVTKPFIEDDALVKIKAAAELHPYKFILVWKGMNGAWEKREIN